MHSQLVIVFWILFIALIPSYCATSKQLSTVFVLETFDSSETAESVPPKDSIKERSLDELTNTRIITDDIPASETPLKTALSQHESTSQYSTHSKNQNAHQQDKHTNQPVAAQHATNQTTRHDSQHNQTPQSHSHDSIAVSNQKNDRTIQANHPKEVHHSTVKSSDNKHDAHHEHNTGISSRKLDEKAEIVSQNNHKLHAMPSNKTVHHSAEEHHHQQHPKHITRSTTISSYQDHTTTTPKTEERLLISISSSEEDENVPQKPPKQSNLGVGGTDPDELPSSHQQQQHHYHKRKPSITISIQDANLKQNGASGQAVIVRPSENGQSIVISTVGSLGIDSPASRPTVIGGGNQRPPSISIATPSSTLGDRDPPYREPANLPTHHQVPSSTHRPSINEYNPLTQSQSNRPVVSTLLDQSSRPQISTTDERPQRPTSINNDDYEGGGLRPTPRPVTRPPPTSDQGGYSDDKEEPSKPTNGEPKYPLNERNCGLVHETRIVGGTEANPDDYLWMAAIIKSRPKEGDARPFCGGSLISRRHILTAAHCLENLAPRDVLVRLGSYDFDDSTAGSLSADYAIDQFRVPAQYSKKTHVADIAIMRLKTPLSTNDNYKTVCMPQPRRSYVGAIGTVTGYGSQSQTFRRAAPKLRQVSVPIWENRKCSAVYKKNLTESFLCAGYEEGGKDACQGDSGGPLMTEGPNERMMLVGVVSHGIGCGGNYPGVYTRTTTYLDWIEKNTRE